MHTVDYDRGVIRCWWLFAVIHWFKEADQPGWVGEGWGARGVIVRILAITQATHPCLITSCLGTIFTFFFYNFWTMLGCLLSCLWASWPQVKQLKPIFWSHPTWFDSSWRCSSLDNVLHICNFVSTDKFLHGCCPLCLRQIWYMSLYMGAWV